MHLAQLSMTSSECKGNCMRIEQTCSNLSQNSLLGPAATAYLIFFKGFFFLLICPRTFLFVCVWGFVYLAFYHPKILWQGVPQSSFVLCEEPTIR